MPYIKQKDRVSLDSILSQIDGEMAKTPEGEVDGKINYLFSSVLKRTYYAGSSSQSYALYCRMMGTLECVKQEAYRKWVAPYENKKERENGRI